MNYYSNRYNLSTNYENMGQINSMDEEEDNTMTNFMDPDLDLTDSEFSDSDTSLVSDNNCTVICNSDATTLPKELYFDSSKDILCQAFETEVLNGNSQFNDDQMSDSIPQRYLIHSTSFDHKTPSNLSRISKNDTSKLIQYLPALFDRLSFLETSHLNLEASHSSLETKFTTLENNYSDLSAKYSTLEHKYSDLENENVTLKRDIKSKQ